MGQRQLRKWLSHIRLDSVRSQIIAFAILAALVPALIISLVSYAQSRRALTAKIEHELLTTASQAAREADVWLKERLYELRVFANSSIVLETARHTVRQCVDALHDAVRSLIVA